MSRAILVTNESTAVSDADVAAAIAAVQTQIDHDFSPLYSGLRADLVFWPKSKGAPPTGQEIVHTLDNSDQAGALGYHELNPAGYPEGFVFAKTSIGAGDPWQTTLSHEVLEQILDPMANWTVQAQMGRNVAWVALEDCDPCENDSYAIGGIPVSNFVLPAWFTGVKGKVDFMGKLVQGLSLDAGGYIAYADSRGNWHQQTGRNAKLAKHAAAAYGRKARYMLQTFNAARGHVRHAALNLGWLQVLVSILQVAPQLVQQVQTIIQTVGSVLPAPAPSGTVLTGA